MDHCRRKTACELEQMKSSQGRRVEHTGWLTYDGVYVTADFERPGAEGRSYETWARMTCN